MHMIGLMAVVSLAASGPAQAKDPFVGKWKLNVSRSTIVDDMRVEVLGKNKYAFNFEGGPTETVVADGTDQPAMPGTTLSAKSGAPRKLTVVRKQDGRMMLSADWTLSPDGRTLHDDFTSFQSDGSNATTRYVYRRISGSSGFAGAWESTTPPVGLELELAIESSSDPKRLRFVSPGLDKSVVFDGREHAVAGAEGMTSTGRRSGPRSLQYSEKDGGKAGRVRRFVLSADGRTLRETIHVPGQATDTVFVFERE
jgi:hypothetical protein